MISLRTAATSEVSCQTCVLVDEDLELPPKDMRQSEHDVAAPSHVHKQQSATLALFANGALIAETQLRNMNLTSPLSLFFLGSHEL